MTTPDPAAVARDALDRHMALMLDWAEGRRSHINTILGMSDDRPGEIAAIARADAAEVEKHASVVRALAALTEKLGETR